MDRLHFFIQISKTYIANGSFRLAYALYNGTCSRHAQDTVHIVLIFQHALLEELVGSGRSLAGIGHDLHIRTTHFFPILNLAGKNAFQLLPGQIGYLVGRMHDNSQSVVGDHLLFRFLSGFLQLHALVEFHLTGSHRYIRSAFHQSGDPHAGATTRHRYLSGFVLIHEILGFSLRKRQTSIATLYLLGKHIRSKQTRCHGS